MGKSKQYDDAEVVYSTRKSAPSGNNGQKSTAPARQRTRRAAFAPRMQAGVSFVPDENMTVRELLHLIVIRMRRHWLALRFQAGRYTFGMTERSGWVKTAILATVFYFIFFQDGPLSPMQEDHGQIMGISLNFFDGQTKPKAKKTKAALPANEAAPVSANQLTEAMALDYIERYHEVARKEMHVYGIPASISLAQGLVESRAGDSKLARNNNNHFGIKCFSRHCKRGHCSNFTDDTHKDFFRKFNSPWESWRAHSLMLTGPRYKKLRQYGNNYRQWAHGLKSVGYATDRTYAEKLIGIIERYDLHRYDR
jgi:flagellum-specific peptidoglycan hydrolase FlgJ